LIVDKEEEMLLLWVAQTADEHEAKPSMKCIACLTSDNALTSAPRRQDGMTGDR
jgi:hypothetical protein